MSDGDVVMDGGGSKEPYEVNMKAIMNAKEMDRPIKEITKENIELKTEIARL